MKTTDLFISACEPSGDQLGKLLLEKLKKRAPHLTITGIMGPQMREVHPNTFLPMEDFMVMGFFDILTSLPKLFRLFFSVKRKILSLNPKAVVFIDYPGFHLRLEKSLKKAGFKGKMIHFVSPTVWAWGKKRVTLMEKTLDELLTIFPFEEKSFEKTKLPVTYVGHPLFHMIRNHHYQPVNQLKKIGAKKKILSIFPGSRKKELQRNFPLQLKVARKLQKDDPNIQICISYSDERFLPFFESQCSEPLIPSKYKYELMKKSDFAIATSGTVNLELALHQVPTVVCYAIQPWDLFIAQKILRIQLPYYCIVNLLFEKEVYPELYGPFFNEQNLYSRSKKFFLDAQELKSFEKESKKIFDILQEKDAADLAAERILSIQR